MLFNRSRAERVMQKHALDALVASSPDNVMYASDYECITHLDQQGFPGLFGLLPGHAPAASLIAPSLELEAIVDGKVWIDDIYIFAGFPRGPAQGEGMDVVGTKGKALLERAHMVGRAVNGLVAALEARGLANGRVASTRAHFAAALVGDEATSSQLRHRLWQCHLVGSADGQDGRRDRRLRKPRASPSGPSTPRCDWRAPAPKRATWSMSTTGRFLRGGQAHLHALRHRPAHLVSALLVSDRVIEAGDLMRLTSAAPTTSIIPTTRGSFRSAIRPTGSAASTTPSRVASKTRSRS